MYLGTLELLIAYRSQCAVAIEIKTYI